MFRAYGPGPSLWESVLPEMALRMPVELARVDELLDDPAFLEPFRKFFDPLLVDFRSFGGGVLMAAWRSCSHGEGFY